MSSTDLDAMLEDLRRENEDLRGRLLATSTVTEAGAPDRLLSPAEADAALSEVFNMPTAVVPTTLIEAIERAEKAIAQAVGLDDGVPLPEPEPLPAAALEEIAQGQPTLDVVASSPLNIVDAALKAEREMNMALEAKLDDYEAKLKQRDEDLVVLGNRIKALESERDLLSGSLSDREDVIRHRDSDLAYKGQVIEETRNEVARLTGLNTMLTDQVGEVQHELAKAQEAARIAQSDLNLLKAVRDEAYGQIDELKARVRELEASPASSDPGIADLQARLEIEKSVTQNLMIQIDSLRFAYDNAIFTLDSNGLTIPAQVDPEGQLEETILRNQALQSDVNDAEKRYRDALVQINDMDNRILSCNDQIATLARQLDEAKTALGQAGTALERALRPTIELINVERGGKTWVEFRVSLDDGMTTRVAAFLDAAKWNGYLRLYPEQLGIALAEAEPEPARNEG